MRLINEYLEIEIAEHGAELMRICKRETGEELLWNGDPAYWKRRAPILFPNVGKTYGNVLCMDGESYPTSQHGFARDMDFTIESSDETGAVYLLKDDASTRARYPRAFELRIGYALREKALEVKWSVRNVGDAEMAFTIGGHPAFMLAAGENQLFFPGKESLRHILLDPTSGTAIADEIYELKLAGGYLPLVEGMFDRDALIFDEAQIEEVWLCDGAGEPRLGMKCPGFPNFGIWSVPGAPFVCLEPWMGRCDDRGFAGEFRHKPNVNLVSPGEERHFCHEILLP